MTDHQSSGRARGMASMHTGAKTSPDSPSSTERRSVASKRSTKPKPWTCPLCDWQTHDARRRKNHEGYHAMAGELPELIRELQYVYQSWFEDEMQAQELLKQLQDSLTPKKPQP